MTTPQEPHDDEPTMLPEAYLQQGSDGSTRPLPGEQEQGEPRYGPDPYAQPQYGQPQYGQAYGQPGYAAYPPGYGSPPQNHPSAQTAMVLGLVGLIGFFFCGLPILMSPWAWRLGARTRREIDASNGTLGGRDAATVGYVTGIIGTVILGLALLALLALIALIAIGTATSTTS